MKSWLPHARICTCTGKGSWTQQNEVASWSWITMFLIPLQKHYLGDIAQKTQNINKIYTYYMEENPAGENL